MRIVFSSSVLFSGSEMDVQLRVSMKDRMVSGLPAFLCSGLVPYTPSAQHHGTYCVTVRWELGARALGKAWAGSYAWELPKSPCVHLGHATHIFILAPADTALSGHGSHPPHWASVGLWSSVEGKVLGLTGN